MKSARELSPQLAARLSRGPSAPQDAGDNGGGAGRGGDSLVERRGGSDYSRLRGIIRAQKEQIQGLEHEVSHFQSRLHRIEDGHRLELARLKKEVEYHKRLRQGADQRSYELEDRLSRLTLQQQRQQQAAAEARRPGHEAEADEEKDGLIAQSQLLISKNSELSTRVKMLESQVSQLEELKAALESELNQAYCERDELAGELERILSKQHAGIHYSHTSGGSGGGSGGGRSGGGSGLDAEGEAYPEAYGEDSFGDDAGADGVGAAAAGTAAAAAAAAGAAAADGAGSG